MTVLAGVTVQWGLSPRIIVIPVAETDVSLTDLQDTLQDLEDDSQGMPFPKLRSMTGGQELDASTNVGFTMQLQNAQLIWQTNNTVLDSGTVTTPDTNGLILIDSTALFITNGVQPGDMLLNITDNSQATILSVVSETQLQIDGLIGGTDNQFDNVDTYSVFDWQLRRLIGGNLVAVNDSGTSISPVINSFGNSFDRTSSSSATIQELQDIQYASFGNGVTIDQSGGAAGQIYPFGTRQSPVNNLTDAKAIAVLRGFDKFFIKGTFTFDVADTVDGYEFEGESFTRTTINLTSAALIENCRFSDAALSGSLDGGNDVFSCRITSLDYIDGIIYDSELEAGTISLGGAQADFIRCYSGVAGGGAGQTPVIDLGGTGTALVIRDYQGGITLQNYTSGTDAISIDLSSGRITFDSTISAGVFTIRGVGFVEDNSTGSAVIRSQILDANQINLSNYEGSVWIDPSTSNTGIEYPVGSPAAMVNNDTDAQTIATNLALYNLTFRGNTTVTGAHTAMKLWGRSPRTTQITIDPTATLSGCEFELCLLSGDLGGNGSSYMITVALKDVTGIFGHLENCVIREGTNTLSTPNGFAMLNKCSAVSAVNPGTDIPIFDLAGSGHVAARSLDGEIIFQNKSSGNDCSLDLDGAVVTLDSTITAGTWRFSGVGTVINNSVGATVITTDLVSPETVANRTWDEVLAQHTAAGSAGLLVSETHGQIRRGVFVNTEEATNGNGYQQTPFNNWSDAVDAAESGLIQTLYLEADATFDRNLFNFEILGIDFPQVDLAGFDFKNTIIRECDVTGAQGTGNSPLLVLTCNMTNVSSFNGSGLTLTAVGTLGIADGAFTLINGLVPFVGGVAITLDMQSGAAGSNANFQNLSGDYLLTNVDHASDVASLYFSQGKVTIEASCTAGSVVIGGNVEVVDNSGAGCTVVVDSTTGVVISDAVGTRVIESTYTADEVLKIMASALAGKVSGAGSGIETFKGLDGATNRIVSTVDVNGNRTAVAADGS